MRTANYSPLGRHARPARRAHGRLPESLSPPAPPMGSRPGHLAAVVHHPVTPKA